AVPELVALLSTDAAGWAAHALGEMGAAAVAAARPLRRLARGPAWTERLRPRPAENARGRNDLLSPDRRPAFEADNRMRAAWASARGTGDTELAVRMLGAGLEGSSPLPAVRLLASLGPLDPGTLGGRLRARVTELVRDGDESSRIDAAQVHWRLTG